MLLGPKSDCPTSSHESKGVQHALQKAKRDHKTKSVEEYISVLRATATNERRLFRGQNVDGILLPKIMRLAIDSGIAPAEITGIERNIKLYLEYRDSRTGKKHPQTLWRKFYMQGEEGRDLEFDPVDRSEDS